MEGLTEPTLARSQPAEESAGPRTLSRSHVASEGGVASQFLTLTGGCASRYNLQTCATIRHSLLSTLKGYRPAVGIINTGGSSIPCGKKITPSSERGLTNFTRSKKGVTRQVINWGPWKLEAYKRFGHPSSLPPETVPKRSQTPSQREENLKLVLKPRKLVLNVNQGDFKPKKERDVPLVNNQF